MLLALAACNDFLALAAGNSSSDALPLLQAGSADFLGPGGVPLSIYTYIDIYYIYIYIYIYIHITYIYIHIHITISKSKEGKVNGQPPKILYPGLVPQLSLTKHQER